MGVACQNLAGPIAVAVEIKGLVETKTLRGVVDAWRQHPQSLELVISKREEVENAKNVVHHKVGVAGRLPDNTQLVVGKTFVTHDCEEGRKRGLVDNTMHRPGGRLAIWKNVVAKIDMGIVSTRRGTANVLFESSKFALEL